MTDFLTTNRLILRPLTQEDAAPLTPLIADYEVSKWLTVVGHPYTIMEMHWFIASFPSPHRFGIEHRESGDLMGVISIEGHLGYWMGRRYWGHGFMPEAARAVVDNWFAQSDEPLRTSYFLENAKSQAVLRGLGFTDTRIGTAMCKAQGRELPCQFMELTKENWRLKAAA